MKKLLSVLFAMLFLFSGCASEPPEQGEQTTSEPVQTLPPEDPAPLELIRYAPSGWGISRKTVEYGGKMIDHLDSLKETGETSPKLSDIEELPAYGYDVPENVERGTFWVSYGDKLYRADPVFETICFVETYFGEGKVLEMPEELSKMLWDAWYYAPYDYYTGTYVNGGEIPEPEHRYSADSNVTVKIKDFHVIKAHHPENNSVTVELTAKTDCKAVVTLDCYASDDNLSGGDWKEITLKAGQPQELTLNFGGFTFNYWIKISVDNTIAEIKIEP